jgi:hypothetical protein
MDARLGKRAERGIVGNAQVGYALSEYAEEWIGDYL